jgi:hypothetical protein
MAMPSLGQVNAAGCRTSTPRPRISDQAARSARPGRLLADRRGRAGKTAGVSVAPARGLDLAGPVLAHGDL